MGCDAAIDALADAFDGGEGAPFLGPVGDQRLGSFDENEPRALQLAGSVNSTCHQPEPCSLDCCRESISVLFNRFSNSRARPCRFREGSSGTPGAGGTACMHECCAVLNGPRSERGARAAALVALRDAYAVAEAQRQHWLRALQTLTLFSLPRRSPTRCSADPATSRLRRATSR